MDVSSVKELIMGSEKAASLVADGFFLSSVMFISKDVSALPNSVMINFYSKKNNELASFSAEQDGLSFSGLSPPMKETGIRPLDLERVSVDREDIMKRCAPKAADSMVSRIVLVLRTSSNASGEAGPCWQANLFLKDLHVLSVIFDAENGGELSSAKTKLFGKTQ